MSEPARSERQLTADAVSAAATARGEAGVRPTGPGERSTSVVRIRVGEVWLGVPCAAVETICVANEVTAVPRTPPHVLGLINVQGRAVPLVDLARYLGLTPAPDRDADDSKRAIVVTAGEMRAGLLCAQVCGIVELGQAELRPPHSVTDPQLKPVVVHEADVGERLCLLVDVAALLEGARVR